MSAELLLTIRVELEASRAVLRPTEYSQAAGFAEIPSRMVATAFSELARNIPKYAGGDEIRLRRVEESSGRGTEIKAVNRGPDITDTGAAMRDHFSSGGTLRLGLPGVQRMVDELSLASTAGEGTRVTAGRWI